ncbi:MAG: hypothetical protein AB1896_19890 [Thermodesulfobacteriota bacterium]
MKYVLLSLVLVVCLVAGAPGTGLAMDKSLTQAMEAFIQAMVAKDKSGVLSFFSQTEPWVYAPYEIGSGRPLERQSVTFQEMARDFQNEEYWYGFFFDEPNGYTYQVNFEAGVSWRPKGPDTFLAPDSDTGNTYIKWRREGERWVIAEIGEVVV